MNVSPTAFDFVDQGRYHGIPADFLPRDWQTEGFDTLKVTLDAAYLMAGVPGPKVFTVSAGVGAGKTDWSASAAAYILNRHFADRVVCVTPNLEIRRNTRKAFRKYGIHLSYWNNQSPEGERAAFEGSILTYQALSRRPAAHARLVRRRRTLVIFDEIHHLGDQRDWGTKALEAFGEAEIIIGLSGTPFRADNMEIPFVTYEQVSPTLRRFVARPPHGYTYPLGRAIRDRVCREISFEWLGGSVELHPSVGAARSVDFDTDVSPETAALRLSGAVRHGSPARLKALAEVVATCRSEGRKLIIFLGGDTGSETAAVEDAEVYLPAELAQLGVSADEIEVVTSDKKDAGERLANFGKSDRWILVSIQMVSEGVDIPELSAALFLSSITSKATTIQRIGRVLRRASEGERFDEARVYMFREPAYLEIAAEIKAEVRQEIDALRKTRVVEAGRRGEGRQPRQAFAIGLDSWLDGKTFNGVLFTQSQVDEATRWVRDRGIAPTAGNVGMALTCMFSPRSAEESE